MQDSATPNIQSSKLQIIQDEEFGASTVLNRVAASPMSMNVSDLSKMTKVRSQVSNFRHRGKLVCQFCLGKLCVAENWKNCKSPIVQGLHSNIISDVLIASQRPSKRLIKEFNIVE